MSVYATELVLRTSVSKPECVPTYMCTYVRIGRGFLDTTLFFSKTRRMVGWSLLTFCSWHLQWLEFFPGLGVMRQEYWELHNVGFFS